MSLQTDCPKSSRMSAITTFAPCFANSLAMDSPRPRAAPTRRRHRHMHHNHRYYRPSLNLIQLGLTLTDIAGNLSDLGTDKTCICQFNFSDFDAAHDASAPNSIELLRR
ncbi:hypothetical protein RJ640_020221 [Escallonia rubra]|uniref:Uncharacterized protein n=1 Tax=Escallonia rubra TaxID=112253 RepID=A0AA88QZ37_9ASTE|nr:hypothetical protein RJ640_020221 [Escallonia rubra]